MCASVVNYVICGAAMQQTCPSAVFGYITFCCTFEVVIFIFAGVVKCCACMLCH